MSSKQRTAQEIRRSMEEARRRLDSDLTELELRFHESLSPKQIFSRHPALSTVLGVALGIFLVRNPALLGRGLARVAELSTPFLLKAFFQRSDSNLPSGADSLAERS